MIEIDVIDYLNDDATLDGLLSVAAGDSKIYPIQKPQSGNVPYIVYTVDNEGTVDENELRMVISFECVHNSYDNLIEITNRLYVLLDNQDSIRNLLPTMLYYIYYAKVIGSTPETKDTEFNYFHKTLLVEFHYHRKVRW